MITKILSFLTISFAVESAFAQTGTWPTPAPNSDVKCVAACGDYTYVCDLNGKNEMEVYKNLRAAILDRKCSLKVPTNKILGYQFNKVVTCFDISLVIKNSFSNCYNYKTHKATSLSVMEAHYSAKEESSGTNSGIGR